jgi:hypothetical protein
LEKWYCIIVPLRATPRDLSFASAYSDLDILIQNMSPTDCPSRCLRIATGYPSFVARQRKLASSLAKPCGNCAAAASGRTRGSRDHQFPRTDGTQEDHGLLFFDEWARNSNIYLDCWSSPFFCGLLFYKLAKSSNLEYVFC